MANQNVVQLNGGALTASKLPNGDIQITFHTGTESNWKLSSTGKREIISSGGKINCLGHELNAMFMRLPRS